MRRVHGNYTRQQSGRIEANVTTFDSAADPRPLVGLIELPDLAELLTACGIRVVTGPDFRTAATAIRDGFQASGAFPLITADIAAPGLRPWLGTISKVSAFPIAIVRGAGAPALEVEGALDLALPFTVDAFLNSLGMPAIGGPAGAAGYPAGAQPVQQQPVPVAMPEPDFGHDDFAAPAPAAAPRAVAPVEEDPFSAPAAQYAPAPVQYAQAPAPQQYAPAPQAPVDDWDTPAPAAEVPSRRARRAAEAPVAGAAPQYAAPAEDDWDTPAPAPQTYAAPAPQAYEAPAPAAFEAPVFEAPAQVQQFEAPAPVQYAAPADDFFTAPQQAPAPVQYAQPQAPQQQAYAAPAPAQPAYAQPDAFEAPAPQYAQPQAPDLYAAPVQPTYAQPPALAQQYAQRPPAPQQYAQPTFEAPAPVYAQPPAPVQQQEFFDATPPGVQYPAPVQQQVPFAADREAAAFFTQQTAATAQRPNAPLGVAGQQPGDSSGIFDDFEASKLHGTGRSAAGLGSFVITYSGKGGVGKSTASLQMAHKAAAAGLKVVLIDGNSGQGDLRTYLRLNRTDLPTIYDAAIGPIQNAILTPAVINRHREQNLGEVKFAFIAAPPDDINDPDVVTHEVYRRVIEFARRNSDLVIMDTQIIESADRTGVVTQLILPALVHDAWGVGVTDMTNVGVNNLNNRLRKFLREEVPKDRLMVMINRVHPEQLEMAAKATTYFHDKATFLGSVEMDAGIGQDMNAGRINISNPQLGSIMSKILLRVTGNENFRAEAEGAPAAAPARSAGKPSGRKAKPALSLVPKPAGEKFDFMGLITRFLPSKKAV